MILEERYFVTLYRLKLRELVSLSNKPLFDTPSKFRDSDKLPLIRRYFPFRSLWVNPICFDWAASGNPLK